MQIMHAQMVLIIDFRNYCSEKIKNFVEHI